MARIAKDDFKIQHAPGEFTHFKKGEEVPDSVCADDSPYSDYVKAHLEPEGYDPAMMAHKLTAEEKKEAEAEYVEKHKKAETLKHPLKPEPVLTEKEQHDKTHKEELDALHKSVEEGKKK